MNAEPRNPCSEGICNPRANYVTTGQTEHSRKEEMQWARIAASGDAAAGMTLIVIQKLCTAFHEFEPAWEAGVLAPDALAHFQARLSARAQRVFRVTEANGLDDLDGLEMLRDLLDEIASAESLAALAALAEPIHAVNHTLVDALEARVLRED
jgi:hypothetical protein